MTNENTMRKGAISSQVAPSASDLAVWQGMTLAERKAVFIDKANKAKASPRRSMTADEIIAEAKAELANG